MTELNAVAEAALAPLREALLGRARADAAALAADAERDANRVLEAARAQATALLAEAEARGQADAEAMLAIERARSRREIRAAELAVQRKAYEKLRDLVIPRVRQLRDGPRYPPLRERLADWVRSALGPNAMITEVAHGGVVGEAPGRYVDCSLDRVADQAIDELGADLEGLWEP